MTLYIIKSIILVMCLAYLSVIDIRHNVVSNKLLLIMGIIGALSLVCTFEFDNILSCTMWSVGIFLILSLISLVSKEKLGMGDAKLVGIITLFIEGQSIIYVLVFSLIVAFVFSVIGLMTKKINLKTQLPYVPFLTAGVITYYLLLFY